MKILDLKILVQHMMKRNKSILKATVSWPIYSGGKNRASLSKNRNLKNRKKLLLDNVHLKQ